MMTQCTSAGLALVPAALAAVPLRASPARSFRRCLIVRAARSTQEKVWRPSLDDVQRISTGDAAKHRGTGSRAVPHRLNAEERKAYDLAKSKGVLTLSGSGYRRERKGSPLSNIWRQWCDAKAQPCVVLAKGAAGEDTVLVDLSPLRLADPAQFRQACQELARQHGCTPQPAASLDQSPFTVILPPALIAAMMAREEGGAASGGSSGSHTSAEATEAGGSAASEEAGSAAAETSGSGGGGGEDGIAEQLAVLRQEAPIWQQPPVLELFAAERGAAKALAKQLAGELQQLAAAAAQ